MTNINPHCKAQAIGDPIEMPKDGVPSTSFADGFDIANAVQLKQIILKPNARSLAVDIVRRSGGVVMAPTQEEIADNAIIRPMVDALVSAPRQAWKWFANNGSRAPQKETLTIVAPARQSNFGL